MKFNEMQLGVAWGMAQVGVMAIMMLIGMVQQGGGVDMGGLLGDAVRTFVDGFLMGYLLGFSYNRLTKGRK